jgi:C-terminal processing protease CtpA/Prc
MQKVSIGILVLLVLFFAAANARLSERERALEDRLAAQEFRKLSRGAVATPVPAAQAARASLAPVPQLVARPETAAPAPTAVPPSAPASPAGATVIHQAEAYVVQALANAETAVDQIVRAKLWSFNGKRAEQDLGLSESQKTAIEELKRTRDLQTQVYKDQIQGIEQGTDLAIRQLLTPEQLQKYDAQPHELTLNGERLTIYAAQQELVSEGPKPGYLGVSGSAASGGGVQIDEVMKESAAQTYGLQPGDVILECNGFEIKDLQGLSLQIQKTHEGSPAALKIRRGGTEFTQSVVLGARQ